MVRIKAVAPLDGFVVRLEFDDGATSDVDLEPSLRGPVFEKARNDRDFFRAVRVDPESGTIVWPNDADLDPDVLRWGFDANGYLRR